MEGLDREVIIVEDDIDLKNIYSVVLRRSSYNVRDFEKPSDAYSHINSLEVSPYACFVDMKPYKIIPKNFNPNEFPELVFPEKIGKLIHEKGWQGRFYFMTQGFSEYDSGVIKRVGANFLLKGDLKSSFEVKDVGGYCGLFNTKTIPLILKTLESNFESR